MFKNYSFTLLLAIVLVFAFCKNQKPETPSPPIQESVPLYITQFSVTQNTETIQGVIDTANKTILLNVPSSFNLQSLKVNVSYTEGATLSPESGYNYNFSNPLDFTLTKDGKSVVYKVTVSPDLAITSITLPQYYRTATAKDNIIYDTLTYGTDTTNLVFNFTIPTGCTSTPVSGSTINLKTNNTIIITNPAGQTKKYTIQTHILPQESMIRAVWVADPSFTQVVTSWSKIQTFVNLLDELNFNTIYLCVWAKSKTLFQSQVLKDNSNYATKADGCMLTGYTADGPNGDLIQDLITYAHSKNIKVIFWLEYGFMHEKDPNMSTHPILSVHPDWEGKNSSGNPANYNGTDFYYNSFDPNVQEFMIKLVEESITLYPTVDGIQGDDRMPASPSNSGYNPATLTAAGQTSTVSNTNTAWVQWRLNNLNQFGKTLYNRVKAKGNQYIVCSSPNPYPWCKDNLMQDWPTWINDGSVQILSVQCYRDNISSYTATINGVQNYLTTAGAKKMFNPGIYFYSGNSGWESTFVGQMQANRKYGTNGESFFYNEGLNNTLNKKVLKAFYTGKAIFPNM